ncbi:3D domain-containing protein [Alteribacter populi]|uniref:3D domain-containing protein n=1 Tax=Alteribacter populi TaxID=2011011 RepID=UPI001FE0938B|nr:3D domain-containing protein [Alteribacter populi]
MTATGYDVSDTIHSPGGRRIVATDPDVIPLGSVVEVRLSDGTTFEAKALDTGGAINGKMIDLLVSDTDTAWQFGRQSVELRVITKGDG